MKHIPLGLIDSHFHLLAMQEKDVDIVGLLSEMHSHSMQGLDVGIDFDDLKRRSSLLSAYPFIHLSAGIGPWGVASGQRSVSEQLAVLSASLQEHKVCAIGEIGLDNHWGYGTKQDQQELFVAQMEMAEQRGLPIIIHSREADEEMADLLQKRTFSRQGIMHCFQGSRELALLAVSKGMFISFAGPITYKANSAMREIFKAIPLDQILLETDSPYLSPVPCRGKTNTPLHMVHIYEAAASLLEMSMDDLVLQMQSNFSAFLGGNREEER
ncbi:MAG: TatD family deoxyribonuclease [Spirochaetia bacterium]|nr:TatD family deoxyribonuclease [Spirochaetia bacterium]